jgi:hypothetical protein
MKLNFVTAGALAALGAAMAFTAGPVQARSNDDRQQNYEHQRRAEDPGERARAPSGGEQRAAQAQAQAQAQVRQQQVQAQAQVRQQQQQQRQAQQRNWVPQGHQDQRYNGQQQPQQRDWAQQREQQRQYAQRGGQTGERSWNGQGGQRNGTYVDPNRNQTYRDANRDNGGGNTDRNWRQYHRGSDGNWRSNGDHRDRNWNGNNGDHRQWDRNWSGNNGDHRQWDRNWRNNNRYDWQRYRSSNRDRYHIGHYYAPYRNYYYQRLNIGFYLDPLFFGQDYWIGDPGYYRLPDVYGPYRWVRYYDDALLVDIYSGQVVDVIYGFFW